MNPPPPPPPPHGENPKSTGGSGLPPGKYDIFIIPPHSSGSGFLYLPSLKPNVNAFAAGFASALICVLLGNALAPAVQAWWNSVRGSGGAGMILLVLAVGVGAWALGRAGNSGDGGPGPGGGWTGGGPSASGPPPNAQSNAHGYTSGPPPGTGPMPNGGAGTGPFPGADSSGGTRGSWQRPAGPPPGSTHANADYESASSGSTAGESTAGGSTSAGASGAAKSAWEKAREETKKKEEQRKAAEAQRKAQEEKDRKMREAAEAERKRKEEIDRKMREAAEVERKRKEEMDRRIREARAKEAREREAREKKREQEAREKKKREDEEAREKKKKEDEEARELKRKQDEEIARVNRLKEEAAIRKEEEIARVNRLKEEAAIRREEEARVREATARAEAMARERRARDDAIAQEKRAREAALAQEKIKKEEEALEKKRKEIEAMEKKLREARQKESWERATRERIAREKKIKEETAAAAAKLKAEEDAKPRGSTYAYSAVGEKTNPWPNGRPPTPPPAPRSQQATPRAQPSSQPAAASPKRPPPATANTYKATEDEAYSYRPYDKPKPTKKKSYGSLRSESSYAASQSTSRTTPPPSQRGPYTTKSPDKIIIKAVYAFNNAFLKTPIQQLVSGVGSVTDGLILRITTEGLFIDDDVRGVPQREWDVKAWTMKLVEVWCPSFRQGPAGNLSARAASSPNKHNPVRRLWGLDKDKPASSEETDALLIDMLQLCKNNCRLRSTSSAYSAYSASTSASDDRSSFVSDSAYGSSVGGSEHGDSRTNRRGQTGEMKSAALHVLRASIRDQEGKRYVFVIAEEESWKVSVGLQRLRRGTQVRALGVSGMSSGDARSTLEGLGWQ